MTARILAMVAGALLLAAVARQRHCRRGLRHAAIMGDAGDRLWRCLRRDLQQPGVVSWQAQACGRHRHFDRCRRSLWAHCHSGEADRQPRGRPSAATRGPARALKAVQRVEAAQRAVAHAPTISTRLEDAKKAKADADQAVLDKSAERGCRENCRQLLQAQVDAAAAEVTSAQAALDAAKVKAEGELTTARAALANIKAPQSATPLADRIGVPAWIIDLLQSALGSIAANGLACCLLLFGAHHPVQRVEIVTPRRTTEKTSRNAAASPLQGSGDDLKQHAAKFAVECLRPDPDGEVDLLALRDKYGSWCPADRRVPGAKIGRALADLFKGAGIPIAERNGRLVAIGVLLKQSDGNKLLPREATS
jgi:hypothetical protein